MKEKGPNLDGHSVRMDPADKYICTQLRIKRERMGLTQQMLGDAVGVSIQQIQKYEKGKNRIASGKLYQFARLLNVPISYFFEGFDGTANCKPMIMAEGQSDFLGDEEAREKELIPLIRAYGKVSDPILRKRIVDLVKTLSVSA